MTVSISRFSMFMLYLATIILAAVAAGQSIATPPVNVGVVLSGALMLATVGIVLLLSAPANQKEGRGGVLSAGFACLGVACAALFAWRIQAEVSGAFTTRNASLLFAISIAGSLLFPMLAAAFDFQQEIKVSDGLFGLFGKFVLHVGWEFLLPIAVFINSYQAIKPFADPKMIFFGTAVLLYVQILFGPRSQETADAQAST